MIRAMFCLLAVATPAGAQQTALSFEAGKSLSLASGNWSYSSTPAGSEARFGTLLAVRCERASRTIVIERFGTGAGPLTIATSSLTRALPVGGRLAAGDPLLDAIAFSRGRFLVGGGTGSVLAIPSWPEPARAIEDCRN